MEASTKKENVLIEVLKVESNSVIRDGKVKIYENTNYTIYNFYDILNIWR